jgi:hypothetical protein
VEAGHEKIEADQEDKKVCRKATEASLERMEVIRERYGCEGQSRKVGAQNEE